MRNAEVLLAEVETRRALEALLFVADGPVGLDELVSALQVSVEQVETAINEMVALAADRGVTIVRQGARVRMVTVPEAGEVVERYLGTDHAPKLSTAALETLSIVAYRQPATRAQLEAVRGVNCDGVLRTLVARGLVAPVGRLEQAGRPMLYGTTFDFLEYMGIGSLDQLPQLPETMVAEAEAKEASTSEPANAPEGDAED